MYSRSIVCSPGRVSRRAHSTAAASRAGPGDESGGSPCGVVGGGGVDDRQVERHHHHHREPHHQRVGHLPLLVRIWRHLHEAGRVRTFKKGGTGDIENTGAAGLVTARPSCPYLPDPPPPPPLALPAQGVRRAARGPSPRAART
eukprot:scaffold67005_cov28-Tisochrysis_lutea.AAC.3